VDAHLLDAQTIKASISLGYVNGIEPTIGSSRISDKDVYYTGALKFDTYKRCYIGVVIKVNTNGKMLAIKQDQAENNLFIEARANNISNPDECFHPLAIWHEKQGLHQLAFHDLLHISIIQYGRPRSLIFSS